tara:strand:+ start:2187 stop:2552 length:366 start_codon:yes stop_codon:yes gene_type:complete
MITKLPQSEGATIGIRVSGKVDQAQEQEWINTFDSLIAQHNKINLLVVIDDTFSVGFEAALTDLKWTFGHMKHMNRLAIVSSGRVIKGLVEIDSFFAKMVNIEEKYFDVNELETAWNWIKS